MQQKKLASLIALSLISFLSAAMAQAESLRPKTVAILLFDGVSIIDYSAPWEIFGQAGYKVFTVAESEAPVRTMFNQRVAPDYSFGNSPKADIVLIPGGRGVRKASERPAVIRWVREEAAASQQVMSVCTGALLLGKAGLLDGLRATTFHGAVEELQAAAPKTMIVRDERYVDNGKVITTAGLLAGIDGAFYLISKLEGKGEAQAEALDLEYRWDPSSRYARAAFPDRYLPQFRGIDGKVLQVEGSDDRWDTEVRVTQPATVARILESLRTQLLANSRNVHSIRETTRANGLANSFCWIFVDDIGREWNGSVTVQNAIPDAHIVSLHLRQQGGSSVESECGHAAN